MTINRIQDIFKAYGEQNKVNKTTKTEKTSPAMKKDEVILSSHTQPINQVYQGIHNIPEVREDMVKELSERIAAGKYDVSAKDIAERMPKR